MWSAFLLLPNWLHELGGVKCRRQTMLVDDSRMRYDYKYVRIRTGKSCIAHGHVRRHAARTDRHTTTLASLSASLGFRSFYAKDCDPVVSTGTIHSRVNQLGTARSIITEWRGR